MNRLESYKILGLSPLAPTSEIKSAFRKMAKMYHPDSSGNQRGKEQFNRILTAYETLSANPPRVVNFPKRESRQWGENKEESYNIFNLGKMAVQSKNIQLRVFAVKKLGNSRQKSAYAFLRKALFDPQEEVVLAAVAAIGNLKVLQAAGDLSAVFSRGSGKVKLEVLKTVGKISSRGSTYTNILLLAMTDGDLSIRSTALHLFLKKKQEV